MRLEQFINKLGLGYSWVKAASVIKYEWIQACMWGMVNNEAREEGRQEGPGWEGPLMNS